MRQILGVAGVAVVLVTASPARADRAAELAAQTLYDKAIELMKVGKPSSACPLLTESQRLDPAAGTQYRLAECFEKTSRTEAAWRLYTEVAEASKKAGRKDREAQARERAEIVRKLLQRMTVTISPELAKAEGLVVMRDGQVVTQEEWNLEIPVAPGEHTVEVRATGKKTWQGTMTARAGATGEVRVPLLEDITLVVEPASKPDVQLPGNTAIVEGTRAGPNKTILIAGIAVTAAAAVAGVGFGIGWGVENAEQPTCFHSCAHLKNLMFWHLVGAAVVGGATLTYTLTTATPKQSGVSRASIWVREGAAGATFIRSW